jgi:hypothetical protein
MEDDSDTSSITELFVQETMDPRIESVMPILSKLHKTVAEMKEVDALAEWADSLTELDEGAGGPEASEEPVEPIVSEDESLTSNNPVGIPEADDNKKIEAHGVHGMKSKPWRKVFKNQAAFEAWLEKHEGDVEVHGARDVEEGVAEDLDANQKRVGQLGPTEKVGKKGAVGKLVGASESVEKTLRVLESIERSPLLEGRVDSPVSQAIIRRIINQHPGLLKYGPQNVSDAVDQVADWVDLGPDDEIGSSDVSGWVQQVARYLQTQAGEGLEEGTNYGDLENHLYYVIDTQTGEVVDGPFDNTGEIPLRLMGFDGGHKVAKGAELKGHDEVDENFINSTAQAVTTESDDPDYDKALKRFKKGLPPKEKVDEGQEDLDAILRIIRK